MNERRPYSMDVRARKAAATRERIVESAQRLFVDPKVDFTLEGVAALAGVSVQTVLRAFGSKEALILSTIGTIRPTDTHVMETEPLTVGQAVARVLEDYESIGDRVIRMLAGEQRIPGFAEVAATGRAMHREWVEQAFADELAKHPSRVRRRVVHALVAATDVYVWQLLRRDLGLNHKETAAVMDRLVRGALLHQEGI